MNALKFKIQYCVHLKYLHGTRNNYKPVLRKDTDKINEDSPLEKIIASIPALASICFKPENVILKIISSLLEAPHQLLVFTKAENYNKIRKRAEQINIIIIAERRRKETKM